MATDLNVAQLLGLLQANDRGLGDLTLGQVVRFITLASKLKNDILLTQPSNHSAADPPDILPPSVCSFLSNSCQLPSVYVDYCWETFKSTVWADANPIGVNTEELFTEHGQQHGLSSYTLYPPQHTCLAANCKRMKKGLLLKKSEARQAVLYTLNDGPLAVYSIHLYCEGCCINYHHNFRVENGQRIYYDKISDNLQVGEHQFVERRVIDLWINLMLVSWTSATNCARVYNVTLSQDKKPPQDWAFGFTLTSDHVWDAFITLSLLEDCKHRQQLLVVPHTGKQKDRLTQAVHDRNIRVRLYGQPESHHYCQKCMRTYTTTSADGSCVRRVWVVVIDGVTVGHPRCGVPSCLNSLASNRHRFCPLHSPDFNNICAIVDCNRPVKPESFACDVLEHQEVERVHRERGQARFQLKERLERARVAHPNDAIGEEHNLEDDGEANMEVEIEVQDDEDLPGPAGTGTRTSKKQKKIRAQFGRKRTHNEQIIVCPCGIIIARETFYNAEGIGSVVEMIKRTFRDGVKPDHIFFDNNCSLAKAVKDDPFFHDIGLTVDVFHFKCKHSETDTFCQTHCNPAAYPELAGTDGKPWYFNSSIAEQTNVWLGGYHAICREMLVDKYNFFLDEMIRRRNVLTRVKLAKAGCCPMYWM